ncbi:CHAP domain-containing protein [Staphylococcus aureus]|uniref:CHAP domain-containing protein n=1 Tax=Staphylococcus aureus TaxID=1280 RepID=UPI000E42E38F|nr:CHAP domain-containing protein [Staphylococcus aureus]GBS10134.1 N-acetylmuramoyl-L-alanine amidase domain-containing protein [Staphylococcus aureus]
MPKNKILIYLLSTTLVLPTLVSPTAYADTPQKDTTAKTTSHDSKKSNDDETSKDTTSKDIDKADKNNTSNQDNNDKKFKTIDDSTSDSNNIIDFIYKNLPQTNINQLLTKNKYDDNYSLTTLIQNLFNLNSDISDYEQPRNGEKSTNDSNKNSDNSIKNDTDTQSSKQDKADNQKAPKSNNTKPSTSNKQPNSPKPTQPNQSNSQPASDDKANQKSSSKDNQSMSDSALDSILDQYSEDAKKTQKDYASQSKKDKNEKSNTKNPQLPTQDELKHKSKPAQSFNNDVNQKDTRATSHLSKTYATDPNYAKKLNSIIKHYQLTQFDDERMPDLDKYERSIKDYDDSSDEFKPFREVSDSMPYPHGQCTWYVYNRMKQFGTSISGDLGDAHNWNNRAQYRDYQVSHTPKRHAAVVFEAGQFGADQHYGHVAFVEKVNSDGSIVISESNVKGLGIISHRTINAAAAEELSYITGK